MKFIYVLGLLNSLIYSIPMWILTIILALFGQVSDASLTKELYLTVYFKKLDWFFRTFFTNRGFSGFNMGNTVWISNNATTKTKKHEWKHCAQAYKWGLLFFPAYVGNSLYILFFEKEKHSYYDNYFEKQARLAAGQQVDIPRSQWPNPNDRWIFW